MIAAASQFFRRVARGGAVVGAAALLSLCVIAGAGVSSASVASIQSTVAANWRGSYDLLVTGTDELADATANTGGLIEQNFVALADGSGVSPKQLSSVRAIAGVEVAAPLAFVGQLQSPSYGLVLGTTEPDGATSPFFSRPRAFDVDLSVTRSDGIETQDVVTYGFTTMTGQINDRPVTVSSKDDSVNLGGGSGSDGTGKWHVEVAALAVPELGAGLVAVDPAAEVALLNEAGGFLDTLARFDALQKADAPSVEMANLLVDSNAFGWVKGMVRDKYDDGPIVPVVTSTSGYPPIVAHLNVTPLQLDDATMAKYLDEDFRLSNSGEHLLDAAVRGEPEVSTIDLTQNLTPFALPELSFALPGATAPAEVTTVMKVATLRPVVAGRADRAPPSPTQAENAPTDTELNLVASPQDLATVELRQNSFSERTYRPSHPIGEPVEGTPLYAPVGSYTPGEVTGTEQAAAYVPFGIYQDDEVTVAQPGPYEGNRLAPSFSGRGAVLSSPGAITSLTAAAALTGHTDVDVVRVRVAGIDGYSPEAMGKIGRVAGQIADLGLDVRVVAGSSLAKVGVYLPEFMSDGSDLGWTTQEWTSLGAAVQVERAQLGAAIVLLFVVLAGVVALASVLQTIGVGPRRREAKFLVLQGWTQQRIRLWFLTEDLPALVMATAAGAISLALSNTTASRWAGIAAAGAFVAVTIACVFAVTQKAPTRTRTDAGSTRPARSATAIGVRHTLNRPAAGLWSGIAVLTLTATAVTFLEVVTSAQLAAGSSRLAELVSSRILVPQTILAIGGLVCGVLLFMLSIREQLRNSRLWHAMLVESGWDRVSLSQVARAQVLAVILPAAALTWAIGGSVFLVLPGQTTTGLALILTTGIPIVAAIAAALWACAHTRRIMRAVSPQHRSKGRKS